MDTISDSLKLSLTFADDKKVDFEDLVIMQQIDSLKKRLKNVEASEQSVQPVSVFNLKTDPEESKHHMET